MKNQVTIPAKHYLGMVSRGRPIPLGFITPWGEDAAAKKRMQTVDSWSRSTTNPLPTTVIDNTPMIGFKLSGGIRRGMQGAQDRWRIEDPRGFELEISSENLSMILVDSAIERGVIQDKCVWAREKGQNLLLTVNSEEYIEAVNSTAIVNSSASWKDVEIGYKVTLKNGVKGQYLGKMHSLSFSQYNRDWQEKNSNLFESSSSPSFIILLDKPSSDWRRCSEELLFVSSPKLSSFEISDKMSEAEAEIFVNKKLSTKGCIAVKNDYEIDIVVVAKNSIKDTSLSVEALPDSEDVKSKHRFYITASGLSMVPYHSKETRGYLMRTDDMNTGVLDYAISSDTNYRSSMFGSQPPRYTHTYVQISDTEFESPMVVKVTTTTKIGNKIEAFI
jgi:hypothetical protein